MNYKYLKIVKFIVVHCTATRCNKPFSVECLIECGEDKFGQCSYHYYVRLDGSVIPLLPESLQGVHAAGYNSCSLGIVYEGGLDEEGHPYELLKSLAKDYPDARILGHRELPDVHKDCPCFDASQEYVELNNPA